MVTYGEGSRILGTLFLLNNLCVLNSDIVILILLVDLWPLVVLTHGAQQEALLLPTS